VQSLLRAPSFILHETARRHYWQGEGLLSIKTFTGGRALYRVDSGWCALDDSRYLLLNHGQPYTIELKAETPVESFCLFFAQGLAADVQRSATTALSRLLDDPKPAAPTPAFFDRTYPHDAVLSPALRRLRAAWPQHADDAAWLDEALREVIHCLLAVQTDLETEVAQVPAARPATRVELYRRLHRARDYAAACFAGPLTLDDLARVAHLSPNHLLRTFRQVFGHSPHQYLTSLRLEQARRLLTTTAQPVAEVCVAVGFTSLASFTRLFRRRYGRPPATFRREPGDFGQTPPTPATYNRA
jgi:AraC family transcriptional regulator